MVQRIKFIQGKFSNLNEGVISFDQFACAADDFVRSLEQREVFSSEAIDNEPGQDRLHRTNAKSHQ
jgi:hypothetical protein